MLLRKLKLKSICTTSETLKWVSRTVAEANNHTPKILHPHVHWYFYQNTISLYALGRIRWSLYIIWPLNWHFMLKNQRNWLKQVWTWKLWSVINCFFIHWMMKLTLACLTKIIYEINKRKIRNSKTMLLSKTKVFENHICILHWKWFFIPLSVKKKFSKNKVMPIKTKLNLNIRISSLKQKFRFFPQHTLETDETYIYKMTLWIKSIRDNHSSRSRI